MQGPPQAPPSPPAPGALTPLDSARPDVLIETFLSDSWEDHLRQHVRMTMTDQALDRRLRALQEDASGPVVQHYLYARP